jgi:uncharacterized protein (TIGR02246 family)
VFERLTEQARRSIFFARYEATHYSSSFIETEHLLLGILREDKPLSSTLQRRGASLEEIRRKLEERISAPGRKKNADTTEVHLSAECHRILKNAVVEADRFSDPHIGTAHLLLALLVEQESVAAGILRDSGVKAAQLRKELERGASAQREHPLQAALEDFFRSWVSGELKSFSSFFEDNAILIDERGMQHHGSSAITEYCAKVRAGGMDMNTLEVTPSQAHFLQEKVAVVPVDWAFADVVAGQAPRLVRSMLVMREHDSQWWIAAAQLTEVRPPGVDPSEPLEPRAR